MDAEEGDRQCGPTDPRPQLPPSRQGLGRIHSPDETRRAARELHAAGLENFNLDLMYALPGQDLAGALRDLEEAIRLWENLPVTPIERNSRADAHFERGWILYTQNRLPEAKDALEVLTARLKQAGAAQLPHVLTFGHTKGGNRELWIERLKKLGPIARDQGVLLVVKQHGGETGTGEACAEIVREVKDDGVWQDGALILHFPSTDQWVGIFLAFQSQAWHTDDQTGHTSPDVPTPGPGPGPHPSEPDFRVIIVGALVNPIGPAPTIPQPAN